MALAFADMLACHGLSLLRGRTTTLQVNVGRGCDLCCRHCHLEAGPHRSEMMTLDTVEAVIAAARRFSFAAIDITGGAPELNMHLPQLVSELAALTPKLIVRTNLTALARHEYQYLPLFYRHNRVVLVASLPALNRSQTEAQRGDGVWQTCLDVLQRLNAIGYGSAVSGLELDLVSNPTGAFLPASQAETEQRFHADLLRRYGISFNNLYAFANAPLGRFRTWLESSGNLDAYRAKLETAFNPGTVVGLMCRSIMSVDWDGSLYDCDFNIAAGLPMGGVKRHISLLEALPEVGAAIAGGDHCYACTAGSGFT